jgi:hypothetical protein
MKPKIIISKRLIENQYIVGSAILFILFWLFMSEFISPSQVSKYYEVEWFC